MAPARPESEPLKDPALHEFALNSRILDESRQLWHLDLTGGRSERLGGHEGKPWVEDFPHGLRWLMR